MKNSLPPVAIAGAVVTACLVLLGGCASSPDCSDSVVMAENAARAERPLAMWIDEVPKACRETATDAWKDALAAECARQYGFHQGRTGGDVPEQCGLAAFTSAYNLGKMLAELEQEQYEIKAELEQPDLSDSRRRDLRQRLLVIARDLPQIEALARMGGFLPPARLPEG
ncbi:MAG: hypothetical protein RQ741_10940 [Wenzhouxiangellaceae bacterium]|nr:hypothetical protein [Wenzhouxiangellaceae bacterium]